MFSKVKISLLASLERSFIFESFEVNIREVSKLAGILVCKGQG